MHPQRDVIEVAHQSGNPLRLINPQEESTGQGEGESLGQRVSVDLGLFLPVGLHLVLGDGVHLGQVTDQGLGLEEARGAEDLGLLVAAVLDLGLFGLLVGPEHALHRVWTERREVLLLVGEQELVAVGPTYNGRFLAQNLGLEDVWGVLSHPLEHEVFRLPKQELDRFANQRPPHASRWQILIGRFGSKNDGV
ncbi:hypothetical protein TorRG33x02_013590 [Trema orientale]|uniref:Uncharacterized protein n=1 Tax=Trema orientale TaxID=63057 RepID=A0A2P5FZR4_TREOI|nr:hypothetical protein TorRG33x02_013590 [Trema orientale]